MNLVMKDPQARVDHAIDWSAYLAGQSLIASAWTVVPDEEGGLTVEDAAFEAQRSSVRLAGGIVGRVYRLINRVTLSDGQEDERTLTMRVEER
ncbi:hypothetical protein J3E64_000362 [Sphingobium sp. OAS761]|uniref:phage fiber-tail adaptor protein n=1 Tax=Sphingobium sp. OAS761 TaxID=2817901 RepID=UPI0020A193D0|nr:hypothetical protein [Sphingobium sp. OAS761]MCP1468695.1 hypothetical protein [Sphingobium sp. OAS761]